MCHFFTSFAFGFAHAGLTCTCAVDSLLACMHTHTCGAYTNGIHGHILHAFLQTKFLFLLKIWLIDVSFYKEKTKQNKIKTTKPNKSKQENTTNKKQTLKFSISWERNAQKCSANLRGVWIQDCFSLPFFSQKKS